MNISAQNQIAVAVGIISQQRKALEWLTDYKKSMNEANDGGFNAGISYALRLDNGTRGSSLNGFHEAQSLINGLLEGLTPSLLDSAINLANGKIKEAEDQIKKWSAEL